MASRWRHTSANHAERGDANLILDLVADGERFACKEFTVLLTQRPDALRIPARRVALFRAHHHAGLGTGHAVTEAWIDDLGRWVLFDGQNGAVWRDVHGAPLGVVDDTGPALTFTSAHPCALGVTVSGAGSTTELGPGDHFRLSAPAGEHRWSVATRTDYGHLRPAPLVYVMS